jgi:uncharacterized protein YndB with AHSA1/START domain
MKKKMNFATVIRAPRERVWELMLAPDTYREWTAPFMEGSYYEGSWEPGSRIRFLVPGAQDGMVAEVAENRRGEFVSLKHIGEIKNGVEDLDSPAVKAWTPAYENYRFVDKGDGTTEVQIEMDTLPGYEQFMQDAWPKALAKLKAVCEQRVAA